MGLETRMAYDIFKGTWLITGLPHNAYADQSKIGYTADLLFPVGMLVDQDFLVLNVLPPFPKPYGQDLLLGHGFFRHTVFRNVSVPFTLPVSPDQSVLGSRHPAHLHQHARHPGRRCRSE